MEPSQITFPELTSRDNQHLKLARSVRLGRESNLIFLEGVRLVREAVISNLSIDTVFVTPELIDAGANSEFSGLGTAEKVFIVNSRLLRSISDTENPQGIAAIAKRPAASADGLIDTLMAARSRLRLALLLYQINNPSNLGAVIRTAEAAGAVGIITTKGSADAYSPKSLRAAMGSAFRLAVWENANVQDVLDRAVAKGISTIALDAKGTLSIYDAEWAGPKLLVLGSEAHGLPDNVIERIDQVVSIPMIQPVESLNLAVSAGIALFEARRRMI